MQGKQPSLTARGAAEHRAAHQILEKGIIFSDPFAAAILGEDLKLIAERHAAEPQKRPLRLYIAARSRFAEDALAAAVARGVSQAVVLGASFDTFALRNPHAGLRVFEVDHPESQAWKREQLKQAKIVIPESLMFASVDFEKQELSKQLVRSGLHLDRGAFFLWLGVVPYLTAAAIRATLAFIAGVRESEVVFDYSEPLETYSPEHGASLEALRERVASVGEPLISHFVPEDLKGLLSEVGFAEIEDMRIADVIGRYLGMKIPQAAGGVHMIRARRV